jgi:hypothetical protein
MPEPELERMMDSDFRLNPLDGDAEDLARRCCTEVRDVEVAVRAEIDGGHCGEAGARSSEAKLLQLVAAALTDEEGPRACAGVEAHDLA